jgi:hypothetical protein
MHIVRLMWDDGRIAEILSTLKKIEDSNLSVREYFDQNIIPFTRPQYYIYRKTLRKYGEEGLCDKRATGNNTKLTQRIKDCDQFLLGHSIHSRIIRNIF